MLLVVSTGAYCPPLVTTGEFFLLEHPTQKLRQWAVSLSLSCLCLCLFVGQVKSPQLSERSQVLLATLLLGRCQDLKIKRQSVTRSHHSSSFPEQLKSKKR